jgi:hypothetical protein
VPLPPYIHRPDSPADRERYQTVFATTRGSVAAPTAGLHFDETILSALRAAGIGWATVTLHVGYGTFNRSASIASKTTAWTPSAGNSRRDGPRDGRHPSRGPPHCRRRHDYDEDAGNGG